MLEVVMPQMGESLTEGTVVRWLKNLGDAVKRDEPLFEISTDKVDTEVPAPAEGRLARILVDAGGRVAVGQTVALLEVAHERAAPTPAPASSDAGHFKSHQAAQVVSFPRAARRLATGGGAQPAGRSFSPAVLVQAHDGGVPLAQLVALPGLGRGGRLTKKDVQRFLQTGDRGLVTPEYLYRPHATAFAECNMSRAEALLAAAGDRFERSAGAPLTYTVLVARVLVAALRDCPALNASMVGESLVLKPHVNLGVALPDAEERIVPVIRGAEELTLLGIARALFGLTQRARTRRLSPQDVQGGTFTLTNTGISGGITGTPILHQPQVGILGLGAIAKRAIVVDDAIAIRPMATLSLTFDYRAADGKQAIRFLERVRQALEQIDEKEVLV